MSFVHHCRLLFADTDASGRIHHSAIFRYFEAAEAEFFRAAGIPYSYLDTLGARYPRVRVEADFYGPLKDDDPLDISVSVERVGKSSFTLAFDVDVNNCTRAHGKIIICCMDPSNKCSCPIPVQLVDVLKKHV